MSAQLLSNTILPGSKSTTREVILRADPSIPIVPGAGAILSIDGVERPYSFANSADSDWVFYLRDVPEGEFCSLLNAKKVGDEIDVVSPFHFFEIEPSADAFYIATGVGIAPFLSALRTFDTPPKRVLYGARTVDDLIAVDEIRSYTDLITVTSRDSDGPNRVTDLITAEMIYPEATYYVCGLDEMVNDVTSRLIDMGAEHEQVSVELFYMKG